MGREHATLTDPAALGLQEDESRALLAAMQPYFIDDGITLHHVPALGPARWLAEGELFRSCRRPRWTGCWAAMWTPGCPSRTRMTPTARRAR
jgi:hypothetical protein